MSGSEMLRSFGPLGNVSLPLRGFKMFKLSQRLTDVAVCGHGDIVDGHPAEPSLTRDGLRC
jgi:hypothetical protein